MKDQPRVFSDYLNRLKTRNINRTHLESQDSEGGDNMPSATSNPDYFSKYNKSNNNYYDYSWQPRGRGAQFERTFNIQNAFMRREKLIRRGLFSIIVIMIIAS